MGKKKEKQYTVIIETATTQVKHRGKGKVFTHESCYKTRHNVLENIQILSMSVCSVCIVIITPPRMALGSILLDKTGMIRHYNICKNEKYMCVLVRSVQRLRLLFLSEYKLDSWQMLKTRQHNLTITVYECPSLLYNHHFMPNSRVYWAFECKYRFADWRHAKPMLCSNNIKKYI